MAINSGKLVELTKTGLAAIIAGQPQYPPQWSEIFDMYHSEKEFEKEVQERLLTAAQIRQQGAPTQMDDNLGDRFTTYYTHVEVACGFIITRIALRDNLYKDKFPLTSVTLKNSLQQAKEILGASVINNASNAAYPIGDGQALLSANHPYDFGVYSNTPGTMQLNEAAIEAAIVGIQQFVDQAGNKIKVMPKKLVVGRGNQFVAEVLLETKYRTGTTNNDISALYSLNSIPEGWICNQFFTNPDGWGIITDAEGGFKHYLREEVETDAFSDPYTNNLVCTATERYSFGNSNAQSFYGYF